MKAIDAISSSLLLTGCVYAAGVSQNNAFMRSFGVSPEFSQPPVDKIFYDGGLIVFEAFYEHLLLSLFITTGVIIVIAVVVCIAVIAFGSKKCVYRVFSRISEFTSSYWRFVPVGAFVLIYFIFLTFMSYKNGQDDGRKLADGFIDKCHVIEAKNLPKDGGLACAFRKDRDSIWYYRLSANGLMTNSALLAEVGAISYLPPKSIGRNSTSESD